MTSDQIKIHVLRLLPAMDLRRQLQQYVDEQRIRAGWVVTCVGSLTRCHLRFANRPDGTVSEGHFEIVSLVGTVGTGGSHLHLSVADGEGRTRGGHLLEGCLVYTTAEIVLAEALDLSFARADDGTTGWKELQISRP